MSDISLAETMPPIVDEETMTESQILAELYHLNDLIRQDQAEIDRLKTETALLRAETQTLEAVGTQLHIESQEILSRLKAMVLR